MRVIVNIASEKAYSATKWRAKVFAENETGEAVLEDVLKKVSMADGGNLHNLLIENGCIMSQWLLYVNGVHISAGSETEIKVKDNSQIHVMDVPRR